MKYTILTITDSDKHFASACDEYVKRLSKDLTIKTIKPSKGDSQAHTIAKDTDNMVQLLQKDFAGWHKVMMSVTGKSLDTHALHQYCYRQEKMLFIIGGPYGLDETKISDHVDSTLSLGSLTMPHGLAKLVLLEQIYRIETIQSGKKYHY